MTIPTTDSILALLDDDVRSDADLWSWLCEPSDGRQGERRPVVPTMAFLLEGLLGLNSPAIDDALVFAPDIQQIEAGCHDLWCRGHYLTGRYRKALEGMRDRVIVDTDIRNVLRLAVPAPSDTSRYLHEAPIELATAILHADRGRVAGLLLPIAREHDVLRRYIFTLTYAWADGMQNAVRVLSLVEPDLVEEKDVLDARVLLDRHRAYEALIEQRYQEARAHVAAGGSLPYPPIPDDE